MRVVLNIDPAMSHWTVGGVASIDRMRHVLAPLGDVTGYSREAGLPEPPLLLVEGLFPLLDEESLSSFLAFAHEAGGGAWTAERESEGGLALMLEPTAGEDFATIIDSLSRWSVAPPAKPLRSGTDLAGFNEIVFQATATAALEAGALLLAPAQTWIEESVTLEPGAVVEANVYLGGRTRIATGAHIQMGARLRDAVVAEQAVVRAYSVVEGSTIGPAATVGPFAHVRPGSELGRDVRVGNFVETKKVRLGDGSKASHLAYLGDADIGRDCNIGAGTITCNYDGFNKWPTVLGDGVFIGSDSQLVAPINLGDGSYVAAGSTVTADVPADALAIARSKQVNKEGVAEKLRERARKKKA